MKSLRARLIRVEAELRRWQTPPTHVAPADQQRERDSRAQAIHQLFDVLEAVLGGPRTAGYGRRYYIEGAVEMAGRIESGRTTDEDRALLAALPAYALAALGEAGVSAEEFLAEVAMLADVRMTSDVRRAARAAASEGGDVAS